MTPLTSQLDSLPRLLHYPGQVTAHAASDPAVGAALVVAVLLALPVLAMDRRTLTARVRACIAPEGSHSAAEALAVISPTGERLRSALMMLVMSAAMPALSVRMAGALPCFRPGFGTWHVVASGFVAVLAMLVVQRLVYTWVHATFFSPKQAVRWEAAWHLTTRLTAAVALLCALAAGSPFVPSTMLTYVAVLALFVAKIPLVACAWSSFFGSRTSYLHFFAYLCALETIPLLAAWHVTGLIMRCCAL